MLKDVNSTDLIDAIALGCRTMASVFNADDNDLPFFGADAWPRAFMDFSPYHGESHVPGRHLNALLNAQAAGIPIDPTAVEKHRKAAFYSFSGPIPVPLNRLQAEGSSVRLPTGTPVRFLDHNLREGMFAMYALARFCDDKEADSMAQKLIQWVNTHYLPNFSWDEAMNSAAADKDNTLAILSPYIAGVARMIGPLVMYWKYCGYMPALSLARTLADKAVQHFSETGEMDFQRMGTEHVHSITCVMSSLAQLADATGDMELLARIRLFYDNGLNQLRNELGWSNESVHKPLGRGELNNSGDILETALILGKHYGAYYDADAERIIRGHILPAQLRDTSFIKDPDNPDNLDGLRNLAVRLKGAFGFAAPYGHYPKGESGPDGRQSFAFNLDIVGGTTASLCEALRSCATYEEGIHRVRLLFDRETEHICVHSPYPNGVLTIIVRSPGPLFVRIPPWVNPDALSVDGADWLLRDHWLFIPQPKIGCEICVHIPLTERESSIRYGDGRLNVRFRGDIVTAMENECMPFTFFPPL